VGDYCSEGTCVSGEYMCDSSGNLPPALQNQPQQLQRLDVTATKELLVGQTLQISVTDENGNPMAADIVLIRPDGSSIDLGTHTSITSIVDQAGIWKTRVSKPGYAEAETDSSVTGTTSMAEDLGKAVESAVSFLKENAPRGGLLILLFFSVLFLARLRRKKKHRVKEL
jgi:hypothetical protein